MSMITRIQATRVAHPFSMNKKLDQYLSENLPDLIDEYKISDRKDIIELDGQFEGYEKRMIDMEAWKKDFEISITTDQNRVERLKLKFNMKEGK